MSTITFTAEDETKIDFRIYQGGAHALPDTSEDRINQGPPASIDSGSDGVDARARRRGARRLGETK